MSCSVKSALAGAIRTKVSVNGVIIPRDLISREVQHHPAPTPVEAWAAAARALVVRELLLQEARRKGLSPEPLRDEKGRRETDDEALIRALVEQEVVTPEPDEETCRRYYGQNQARFRSRDLFEASHILVAAHPNDAAARDAARHTAAELISQLRATPQLFGKLADIHSACPSGKSGGNLGQIGPGDTIPEFEEALYRLSPGEMTQEPVESRYGFHIIRLDRRIDGRELPFELVRDRIAGYLAERSRRTAIAQYVARLAAMGDVSGVSLPTPADMRVSGGPLQ
jgi:peptidyl-prolyl cis-trans isomerase C